MLKLNNFPRDVFINILDPPEALESTKWKSHVGKDSVSFGCCYILNT